MGGHSTQRANNTLVELYNWQTGQLCSVGSLPSETYAISGVFLEGYAVFCGGLPTYEPTVRNRCYRYDKTSGTWIQVLLIGFWMGKGERKRERERLTERDKEFTWKDMQSAVDAYLHTSLPFKIDATYMIKQVALGFRFY